MPGIPIVAPSSSSIAGYTRTALRHRLAAELGYFATGTVTTEAASVEATRTVISRTLQSDQAPPEHLDKLFLYVRDGDDGPAPRLIVRGSLDGPIGAFVVDREFSAPLEVGTGVEVSVLPGDRHMGASGLNEIINLALEQLPVLDVVSMTAVSGQTEYSLASFPWSVKRVTRVFYTRTDPDNERRREFSRGKWEFQNNAEDPVLSFREMPANPGEDFEVEIWRPASSWIKDGGAWGDSLVGLQNEDDACLYEPIQVVTQALPIALKRLAQLFERGSKERTQIDGDRLEAENDRNAVRLLAMFRGSGAQSAGAR